MAKVSVEDKCKVCGKPLGEGKAVMIATVNLTKEGVYGYRVADGGLRVKFPGKGSRVGVHVECFKDYFGGEG